MRHIVVDANVFVSLLTGRQEKQRDEAAALLQSAENGALTVILPQFVVFELTYVLQSVYGVTTERLTVMLRDLLALPGVLPIDECPWRRVLEIWPDPLPSLADAAIVAVAANSRYDAVATFDRKLATRLKNFGLTAFW